jgi:hypothetical protein
MKAIWLFIKYLPELIIVVNRIIDLLERGATHQEIKQDIKILNNISKEEDPALRAIALNNFWNHASRVRNKKADN